MINKNTQKYVVIILLLAVALSILFYFYSNLPINEPFTDFKDENGKIIDIATVENEEQRQAEQYIEPDSVVLELGARYGTVSCIINKKLNNKKNQVSVEPDTTVWEALESNKARSNSEFHILKGFVSRTNLKVVKVGDNGYGTTFEEAEGSDSNSYTVEQIESMYKLKFNTLVADCEGCLEKLFDENPNFYNTMKLIIFEQDYPQKCNYNKIIDNLRKNKFREVVSGFHSVWKKA